MTDTTDTYSIFSFGGGVQSIAVLVLQAQGKCNFKEFVFANVGADSENPQTLEYFENIALPYAKRNGITLATVARQYRGSVETLAQRINREQRSVPIPAYLPNGVPGNRTCTIDHKIKVIDKYLADQGHNKVVIGLGISLDEIERAKDTDFHKVRAHLETARTYPLLDMRITRAMCVSIIQSAGLPIPPKSSCYFCPFHRASDWVEMRRTQPDLFAQAIKIEVRINEVRRDIGRDPAYLHRSLKPLDQAVGLQASFFDDDSCESGYCHT